MQIKRREFVLTATAAMLAGCQNNLDSLSIRPRPKLKTLLVDTSRGLVHDPASKIYKRVGKIKIIARNQWTAKTPKYIK